MDARVKKLMGTACGTWMPWETAVQVVSSLFASSEGCRDVSLIHAAVGECMRLCIVQHKSAEALRIHELLSRSGHAFSPQYHSRRRRHRHFPVISPQLSLEDLQGLGADELALVALQQQPHRAYQSHVVAQIIAAEDDDSDQVWDLRIPSDEGSACSALTAHTRWCALSPSNEVITTETEQFRIVFQQNIQLLRTTGYLNQRLGLHYLLSQMRRVVDDRRLSSQVEVDPLVRVGRAVLGHSLVFTTPSTEAARRQLLFEDLDGLVGLRGLSEVQRAKLAALESTIFPVRALCKDPLKFMHSLAASWDELFLRRTALTLVLPEEAHDVLPHKNKNRSWNKERKGRSHGRGRSKGYQLADCSSSVSVWTDPLNALFGGTEVHTAAERVEAIISRRIHHNVLVPDVCFMLHNFNQLQQLARYREVVIPHSVFLELVHSALDDQGPCRFYSRRVLQWLMHSTTTTTTTQHMAQTWKDALSPYSAATRTNQGGVTLLGLQDEVALLEDSSDRFFMADTFALHDVGECSAWNSSLATVLVAKQLEKRLSSAPGEAACSNSPTQTNEVDYLVAGVVAFERDENNDSSGFGAPKRDHGGVRHSSGKPIPFFKSRSRSYWARTPVVLATTSDETRRAAFVVGLSMFPPVSAA